MQTIQLHNGVEMPMEGFGVFKTEDYEPKEFSKTSVRLRFGGCRNNDRHRASLCRDDACKG